ncbi:serine hydrolase domain-containing protein [Sphingobium algorifonticola]|uniref:Class A beta-lactamase-related serine hydrolase n=1 Tax=Sphingobium algorifonticola TaxID=2008318 RepID=A0A437J707_9SPHN|nr:serine hydrolase domain-containing protein [Sphingobium algorifonticola]RVT40949.1 class A beta-lactamase-related serine hydrolase [Sphingobium algorifonticola]
METLRTSASDEYVLPTAVAAGFDAKRLARIPDFVQRNFIDAGILPHAHILLSRDGNIVLDAVLGAARADGTALRHDALFRIASMTKPITSVAFMMLVEEGLVALDTPVAAILPEFATSEVRTGGGANGQPFATRAADGPMRMIDLLRHTSGLTYSFQARTPIDAAYGAARLDVFHQTRSSDEYVAALAALPLEFSPGSGWNYSVATDVLGIVIERVTGMPLDRVLRQRIFDPLAMHDSFFVLPKGKDARLTDAWQRDADGVRTLYDRGEASRWRTTPGSFSGGGGLLSSTHDYHRFCLMLRNGGTLDDARLLSPKTIALMTANHLPGGADLASISQSLFSESQNGGIGFGLGFAVTQNPAVAMLPGSVGEYYWGGMLSTFFFIDPCEGLIALFMTQVMPSSAVAIRRELKTLIYAALTDSRA